jgi:peroxiredoxin
MKRILFSLFLIPLICLGQTPANPQHRVKVGDLAPDFTLKYLDGKTIKLSELRGKVVLLQFTASWCSVCLKEMPHLEREIWAPHKGDPNFVMAGIDLKEDKATIEKFAAKAGVTYPLLLDPEGAVFELFAEKGAGVTRNVLIGQDGKIVFLTRLFDAEEFQALKAKLASLLVSGAEAKP